MGLVKKVLLGRENGIRARLRRRLLGAGSGQLESTPARQAARAVRPPGEAVLGRQPEAPKDVTPPEGYEVVLHRDALKPGEVTEVIVGGQAVCLANVDGEFHAVSNVCPHAEGPLGEGTLEGVILTCPYHGWTYDVTTGACGTNPDIRIDTYDVVVEGEAVCVRT